MIISDSIGFNVDRNVDEKINIDIDSETESCVDVEVERKVMKRLS